MGIIDYFDSKGYTGSSLIPMIPLTRHQQFTKQFPSVPAYRWKQIEVSLFDPAITGLGGISTLPKSVREHSASQFHWMSVAPATVLESNRHDTWKAALSVEGGALVETVLMLNRRDQWTICVSSQVGCAMRCTFCATGRMGFTRNLTSDEIVDQYRFWNSFLEKAATNKSAPHSAELTERRRISNIVFMGMGEPLANYENVREAVSLILKYTDVGPTHITVSTVGMLPQLQKLLEDKEWPPVRLAVSLHSADPLTRKQIVPTSYDAFLTTLTQWAGSYLKKFGNRRHHLTFEYVLLSGVNDDDAHARKLAKFVNTIGQIKVNLIPYNTTGAEFTRSTQENAERFLAILHNKGVIAIIRKTMGDDIAAACGQLITETNQTTKEPSSAKVTKDGPKN